jgi:hypothetical protein
MTTLPLKALRQIGNQHWVAGINNLVSNHNLTNQIISWHESGWVYSMHLLNMETEASGNTIITVRQDVYKLDKYPGDIDNLLDFIVGDDSNEFKKASDLCVYEVKNKLI